MIFIDKDWGDVIIFVYHQGSINSYESITLWTDAGWRYWRNSKGDSIVVLVHEVYFNSSGFIFHSPAEITYNKALGNCHFEQRGH
ncbi:MAG: hypothetical protein ACYTBX_03695 [Planctomycetota bacterium]